MNSRITVHHLLLSNLLILTQTHHLEQSALKESMDRIEHHLENMNVQFFSSFLAGHFGPSFKPGLKFIYSEKATNFCEISTKDLSYVVTVKSAVEILQNFEASSEYMSFTFSKQDNKT